MTQPSTRSSKAIGALIGALAALSVGGVGLAFAQDATETPTTEAPAVETPATPAPPATPDAVTPPARGDREDCPEKDGAGAAGDGSSSSTADSSDAAGEV